MNKLVTKFCCTFAFISLEKKFLEGEVFKGNDYFSGFRCLVSNAIIKLYQFGIPSILYECPLRLTHKNCKLESEICYCDHSLCFFGH